MLDFILLAEFIKLMLVVIELVNYLTYSLQREDRKEKILQNIEIIDCYLQ